MISNVMYRYTPRCALAAECLKHHIYIPGWLLQSQLEFIKYGVVDDQIAVAYHGDKPVGVVVIGKRAAQCYVRPAYRRQQIGRTLVHSLAARCKRSVSDLLFLADRHSVIDFANAIGAPVTAVALLYYEALGYMSVSPADIKNATAA